MDCLELVDAAEELAAELGCTGDGPGDVVVFIETYLVMAGDKKHGQYQPGYHYLLSIDEVWSSRSIGE